MEGPFNLAIYLMKLDFRITTKISPVRCAVFTCSVMSDSATLWTVARQAPLFMGILQARILEWVAISFSRGSSQPRDRTQVSHIADGFFAK